MMTDQTRFYFNVVARSGTIPDEEGTLLPSLQAARNEALLDARMMMSEAIRSGIDVSGRSIEICNDAGEVMLVVSFREAITAQA